MYRTEIEYRDEEFALDRSDDGQIYGALIDVKIIIDVEQDGSDLNWSVAAIEVPLYSRDRTLTGEMWHRLPDGHPLIRAVHDACRNRWTDGVITEWLHEQLETRPVDPRRAYA